MQIRLPSWGIVDIFVVIIVVVGCFLRLYHIPNTLAFLGDQGRDALIASHIFTRHDFALIGPVTSVGNMYLGPFYYYFMVPFLALTYPNPIGPAYGVALVNCISLGILYFIAKRYFSKNTALVATSIYALMPLAITFSRFSWNPNLGAPVGLLLFWSLVKWQQHPSNRSSLLVASLFGILIQLHYVTLTTLGVIGFVWIYTWIKQPHLRMFLIKQFFIFMATVILWLSPLIVFDFRHDHLLSRQFVTFFTSSEHHMQSARNALDIIKETEGRMYRIVVQVVSSTKRVTSDRIAAYVVLLTTGLLLFHQRKTLHPAVLILIVWLGCAIIGTAFYSSSILDHYLTYCYPLVALLWAWVITQFWTTLFTRPLSVIAGVYIINCLYVGLSQLSFSGIGLDKYIQTTKTVIPYIEAPYNIALIGANGDYQGMNYRYFFDSQTTPPENNEAYHDLKTLVVIDELKTGNPLSVPAYEIQAPHLSSVSALLEIPDGPRVFIYK